MPSPFALLGVLIAVPSLLVLAGCNGEDRSYYQSRYIPENGDEAFSAHEKSGWHGDLTVYELPASAPELGEEHHQRLLCDPPGPRFKAQTMVGNGRESHGSDNPIIASNVGGWDDRPQPVDALQPDHLPAQYGSGNRPPGPALTTRVLVPMSGWETRPLAVTAPGVDSPNYPTVGKLGDRAKTDYCLPDEVPPPAVESNKNNR